MAWVGFPWIYPDFAEAERDPRHYWRFHLPVVAGTAALFFVPAVRAWSGVRPVPVALAYAAHLLVYAAQVFGHASSRRPRLFALTALLVNTWTCAAAAWSTSRSASPAWLLYFVYPQIAARAFPPSLVVLAVVAAVPLLSGAAWAAAGPAPGAEGWATLAFLSAAAGVGYAMLSRAQALTRAGGVGPERSAAPAPEAGARTVRAGALSALLRDLASPRLSRGDEAPVFLPGDLVDRFRVVREIGRGGFATVYEARDTLLDRPVALKVVRPRSLPSAGTGGELLAEAEAVARLQHPGIVTLHDVRRLDRHLMLVLELLRGATLAARLDRGPLPRPEALRVALRVAEAMAHAHAAGVVHRDLKPANVFLAGQEVKLLDFGLARVLGCTSDADGTPGYMSPEQRRGEPADPRDDVFAAGVMLRECLTGESPRADRVPAEAREVPAPLLAALRDALAARAAVRPSDGRSWLERLRAVERELDVARSPRAEPAA